MIIRFVISGSLIVKCKDLKCTINYTTLIVEWNRFKWAGNTVSDGIEIHNFKIFQTKDHLTCPSIWISIKSLMS